MPAGRPRKEIDWELVKELAELQCTQDEIASALRISTNTLRQYPQFLQLHKEGLENGRKCLRRWQYQKARDGNVTMLIWLGKQYLGQRDRIDHTVAERPEDVLEDFNNAHDDAAADGGE